MINELSNDGDRIREIQDAIALELPFEPEAQPEVESEDEPAEPVIHSFNQAMDAQRERLGRLIALTEVLRELRAAGCPSHYCGLVADKLMDTMGSQIKSAVRTGAP